LSPPPRAEPAAAPHPTPSPGLVCHPSLPNPSLPSPGREGPRARQHGIAPGLYVHLPFCSAICPYCDFAVLTGGAERRARFVASLRREAQLWAERPPPGGAADSVYLGGGTPSLLAPEQLAAILDELRARLPVAADAWLSMEANPEDVTPAILRAWRDLGVGTLTLGVQSFAAPALRFLGRRHDGTQARRAVAAALDAGFPVVGVDLIYGLPDQDGAAWAGDLDAAVALAPHHLSCYQLTVHAGTPFGFRQARGTLRELPEDGQAALFRLTHQRLADAGYAAYEVSNFARAAAHRSRHNRKYWSHAAYLGLGPSAHSFDGRRRWWNERKVGVWERAVARGAPPVAGEETLAAADLALERVMLGLRTVEGVDLPPLRALGFDLLAANAPLLERLQDQRLLRVDGDRLVPTLDGWAVADGLAGALSLGPCIMPPAAGDVGTP
jgi:oxygen-independent coproporphyrinogen III oxidase